MIITQYTEKTNPQTGVTFQVAKFTKKPKEPSSFPVFSSSTGNLTIRLEPIDEKVRNVASGAVQPKAE